MARYHVTLQIESGTELDQLVAAVIESDLGGRVLDAMKIELAS